MANDEVSEDDKPKSASTAAYPEVTPAAAHSGGKDTHESLAVTLDHHNSESTIHTSEAYSIQTMVP